MIGKIIAYTVSIFTFFYILLVGISFFLYINEKERINDICYDAAETVSAKGILSEELYSYIKSSLQEYGDYEIEITLEKNIQNGEKHAYYYGYQDICGMPLGRGDRITICAIAADTVLFEKITGVNAIIGAKKTAIVN